LELLMNDRLLIPALLAFAVAGAAAQTSDDSMAPADAAPGAPALQQ
jgi:hypothetical protein